MLGVTPEAVHSWVAGKRPIPPLRHLALIFLVVRLTGRVGAWVPPQSRYARRSELTRENAAAWAALARDELTDDLGGHIPDDLIARGYELGRAALAKLEAADAA